MGVKKINSKQAAQIVATLRQQISAYFIRHKLQTAVFGKSKGVDSSVIAGILADIPSVIPIGAIMPCESAPDDEKIGKEVLNYYHIPYLKVDLTSLYQAVWQNFTVKQNIGGQIGKIMFRGLEVQKYKEKYPYAQGNIKARLRMITLYHIAQVTGGAVIGSGNHSEYMTGFWTLHGDVGDIYPLAKIYKTQLYPIAEVLKVPKSSFNSVPTDGLNIAGTDEEQLGIKYEKLDKIIDLYLKRKIRQIKKPKHTSIGELSVGLSKIQKSEFKRKIPIFLKAES